MAKIVERGKYKFHCESCMKEYQYRYWESDEAVMKCERCRETIQGEEVVNGPTQT